MWRFCWSHLTRALKNDFYETFYKTGKHKTEATRYSTKDWLQKFKVYLELLTNGTLDEQDHMSLDIFPSRLKKNPNVNYIRCKHCGEELDIKYTKDGLCNDCWKKAVYTTIRCTQCGKNFEFTNGEKRFYDAKNLSHPKKCKKCREHPAKIHTYDKQSTYSQTNSSDSLFSSIKSFFDSLW